VRAFHFEELMHLNAGDEAKASVSQGKKFMMKMILGEMMRLSFKQAMA